MFDMRVLEYFVRIAEHVTLAKASIGLDTSPSILSRQISALERSLGYRVFNRTGRGVTLTERGKRLLPRAMELLRSARELAEEANSRRGEIPLCVVELVLVAPPGDRLTARGTVRLRQLRDCPLILPGFPHALRRLVEESCAKLGFAARVALEVDSLSTMKEVVASGGGYTIAPFDAVAHDVAANRVQDAIQKLISIEVRQWIEQGRWNAELP